MLTGAVRDYVMTRDGSLSEASAAILANHSSRIRTLVHRQGVAVMVCPYLPWLGRSIDHRRERERKCLRHDELLSSRYISAILYSCIVSSR